MDHLGRPAVNTPWEAATAAAIEVGDGVAALRAPLAELIAADRMAAQVQADLYAHTTLGARISSAYPGVPIVSEEDAFHAEDRPADYWLIDPIDGTASWSSGFPGFVCQLARIVDGSVVFGVIHAPVLGSTWTAVRGDGAYLDGKLLPVRQPAPSAAVVLIDNYPEPRGVCYEVMQWLGTDA